VSMKNKQVGGHVKPWSST